MPRAAASIALTSPVEDVPGVGPELGDALRALGVPSVAHLINHLPFRHEREEAEQPINQISPGQRAATRGEVSSTRVSGGYGRARRFEAVLMDETGRLDVVWFHRPGLHRTIHPGMRLLVSGQARRHGPYLRMANPAFRVIDGEEPPRRQARLRPIYPASERITSGAIERAVGAALEDALPLIEDHLPEAFCRERDLPSLAEAYRMLHAPTDEEEIPRARRRLAYDELLFLQLAILRDRLANDLRRAAPLPVTEEIDARIRGRLPFALTPGQDEAVADIARDLSRDRPANRLIQGDVGSGKTVVALYAMLAAAAHGRQAALLAPTELLAEQHFESVSGLLKGSRVRLALVSASLASAERERVEADIAAGHADLIIGTHALLTERVGFRDLGVVVIDEQHRFGVRQRTALQSSTRADAPAPHTFVMTATPIPRSLTQTIFGDLDITSIRGLPPGRGRIQTLVRTPADRAEIDAVLTERCARGEQAYIVVPAIETDASLADVRSTLERIRGGPLAGRRVAAVHGRLSRASRQAVMERFRLGAIDALVATTVIEVGVDVPNASLMVVEHAERFGLAQLHQLRGRIGRGGRDSLCVLVAEPRTPDAQARIEAIAATSDGFALAEKDLEIRGPGDLAGVRQSGAPALRVADLLRDTALVALARRDARDWLTRSPRLNRPEDTLLARRLDKAIRAAGE